MYQPHKTYNQKNTQKMKIGILTHPLRFNYGGILQNYALQQTLKRMGHDVYTIDVHQDKTFAYRLLSYLKRNLLYIFGRKNIPTHYYINITRQQFLKISENIQPFISSHIKTTEYIKSYSDLKKTKKYNFDAYVVGSDQVWQKQFAPATFFDFIENTNVRKVAYAASFGNSKWYYGKPLTAKCKRLAQLFNGISVRESSAIQLCKEYFDVSATLVLDPTLLLTQNDYNKLCSEVIRTKKNTIMKYILDDTALKKSISNTLSERLGLTIEEVKPKEKELKPSVNIEDLVIPPISEWLAGFRDADFVVTDSFHGMVFSIIYNKQFIAIGNYKRGIDRLTSLLSMLNLMDRLVTEDVDIDEYMSKITNIDYNKVNDIINRNKTLSKEFLLRVLS